MVQSFPDRSVERTSILSILLLSLGLSLCVVSQSTAQSPANGPKIEHIGPVAPDMLALKIQAGHFENPGQRPYEKQPGDQIRLSDKQVLAWQEGEIVSTKKDRHLYRDIDIYIWPAMTEYTVHQTIGRVSYYWGFLSAHDRSSN